MNMFSNRHDFTTNLRPINLPSQHVHRKANSFYQEFVRFNHVASVILNADSRRMSSEALF